MNQPPEFDRYAQEYEALHRQSIRASGEEPGYFSRYKAQHLSRSIGGQSLPSAVLDFGCGIGGLIGDLASALPSAQLTGVDVSSESILQARSRFPGVDFRHITGQSIPLPDASVDLAVAACVFHHIAPQDRLHWTRELNRVLKPGGQFFIYEHNPLNPLTRKVVRDCEFDHDAILLPLQESRELLANAGFGSISHDYIVFFPRSLGFLRPLERVLRALPVGAQYAIQGTTSRRVSSSDDMPPSDKVFNS